jgi:hypothetical protein
MGSERPMADLQRSRALAHANRVRTARASMKRALANGQRNASEVISNPPFNLMTMPVGQIVGSQRGWGPIRSRRLLGSALVPEGKHVGTLTERQRRTLLAMMDVGDGGHVRVHELSPS